MQTRFLIAVAAGLALIFTALAPGLEAAKKKKKADVEPVTQTLPVLKDPPLAVVAETDRLSFRVAPLSGKGLLSSQVREALKYLIRENHGSIVKLRAFVAGTGDMRRVGTIVSETFTEKRLSLPALTTLQVGGLPLEGAQVVIESVAVEKKPVNPHGVVLLEAMPVEQIQSVMGKLGLSGNRVLRATCYLPSLENHAEVRGAVTGAFPVASVHLVQMQRLPVKGGVTCEAVAALERTPASRVEFRERAVLIPPSRIVITGAQLAFHSADADVKLAFERLGRTLEASKVSYRDVVAASVYPLAEDVAEKVRRRQSDFFSKERPPVVSSVLMEGLPSIDSSFAVEVIALL